MSSITAVVIESIMGIKESVNEALRQENQYLQKKVNELRKKLILVEMSKITLTITVGKIMLRFKVFLFQLQMILLKILYF